MLIMKLRKQFTILLIVIISMQLCACQKEEKGKETSQQEAIEKVIAIEDTEIKLEIDKAVYQKGYDLPIDKKERTEAENDCKRAMEQIRSHYEKADKGISLNVVISEQEIEKMMDTLSKSGAPVSTRAFFFDMYHYERMEDFLNKAASGEKADVILYYIQSNGGIVREKFTFDGEEMYMLYTNSVWNEETKPVVTTMSYSRIREWEYTKKGWFCYELCVPVPPEVSEAVNGNNVVRVKPLKREYRETSLRYLLPIGYQGNNLFCSQWDAEHMEDLDYTGLYEYLYYMEYGEKYETEQNQKWIPQEQFEGLIMKYLPVSAEQLRKYAVYDEEKKLYAWVKLGCGNYAPNAFGTSIPEITNIRENKDGTSTITVDAVCEMLGTDVVFTHELTVRFIEDGGIEYIENHISGNGRYNLPFYQKRLK